MKLSDALIRLVAYQVGTGITLVIAAVVLTPFVRIAWAIVRWIWEEF